MKVRTRRAGMPTARLQSRLGSGEGAGARESIYESGNLESRKTEAAARKFMEQDPAVAGGLMAAELHPFPVALERKNP